MYKKSLYAYIIVLLLLFFLAGCSNRENVTITENTSITTNIFNNNTTQKTHIEETSQEEELASFSTKLNGVDTPRTHNINITTSTLNGTTIKNGETFSFCDIIGNPTAERGYQEADSFDSNGNVIKTLGGGNCQVSSTLYNAVLQINSLQIKERHAHSKEVHYVEKNKDAAVSYGSIDFKFKNNTGGTIKIYSYSDLNTVNIRIVKTLTH